MTGWDKIVLNYNETGTLGKCPQCGAAALKAQRHINYYSESLTVQCDNCGASQHYDGCLKPQKNK